jgi:hypothetical protein
LKETELTIVVLPTSEVIREFIQHDTLFCFYEGGIRGLVRDSVLLAADHPYEVVDGHYCAKPRPLKNKDLMEKVLRDYENSLDWRWMENHYRFNPSSQIAILVDLVDFAVGKMMRGLFVQAVYEICKTTYTWLGDDLAVSLKVLEDTYAARHHHLGMPQSASSLYVARV